MRLHEVVSVPEEGSLERAGFGRARSATIFAAAGLSLVFLSPPAPAACPAGPPLAAAGPPDLPEFYRELCLTPEERLRAEGLAGFGKGRPEDAAFLQSLLSSPKASGAWPARSPGW